MESASGLLYRNGEFIEANAVIEYGTLVIKEGLLENADITGIILPRPVNCHTHLGDAFIKKPDNATVEELVSPPNGLKHRMLAEVDTEVQISAMAEAAETMAVSAVRSFIDFREGGLEGASKLLRAVLGTGLRPIIMGRPIAGYEPLEMDALLGVVDGIGLSAISDIDNEELQLISDHARSAGKILGMHASEAIQEDSDAYLGLKPDFLVHMVKADEDDLAACHDADIPVVVCPSANDYFGLKPPVRQMLDAGITVCLGTDNAMLSAPDIFREMRFLADNFDLDSKEVLSIVFENGGKVLNSLPGLWAADRKNQDFFVLEAELDSPWGEVLEARPENVRLFDKLE